VYFRVWAATARSLSTTPWAHGTGKLGPYLALKRTIATIGKTSTVGLTLGVGTVEEARATQATLLTSTLPKAKIGCERNLSSHASPPRGQTRTVTPIHLLIQVPFGRRLGRHFDSGPRGYPKADVRAAFQRTQQTDLDGDAATVVAQR
jgi:hypothetical protein